MGLQFKLFIHIYTGLSEKAIKAIQESYEGANDDLMALLKLKNSLDDLIEDAILSDGRGHFISSYDGEEHEVDNYFIYRLN